jgi:hypothetical protein
MTYRYCLRFLPIGACCYANIEEIEKAATALFKESFFADDAKPSKVILDTVICIVVLSFVQDSLMLCSNNGVSAGEKIHSNLSWLQNSNLYSTLTDVNLQPMSFFLRPTQLQTSGVLASVNQT